MTFYPSKDPKAQDILYVKVSSGRTVSKAQLNTFRQRREQPSFTVANSSTIMINQSAFIIQTLHHIYNTL